MTKECTFKEAWLTTELDKIQPNWRNGFNVTQDTKDKIIEHVQDKYKDLLEDANCLTLGSFNKTLTRIREKEGIKAKSAKKDTDSRNKSNPSVWVTSESQKPIKSNLASINVRPETKALLALLCLTYNIKDYDLAVFSAIDQSMLLDEKMVKFHGGKKPTSEDIENLTPEDLKNLGY